MRTMWKTRPHPPEVPMVSIFPLLLASLRFIRYALAGGQQTARSGGRDEGPLDLTRGPPPSRQGLARGGLNRQLDAGTPRRGIPY